MPYYKCQKATDHTPFQIPMKMELRQMLHYIVVHPTNNNYHKRIRNGTVEIVYAQER